MLPTVHASMAFVWCSLSRLHPAAIQRLELPSSMVDTRKLMETLYSGPTPTLQRFSDESYFGGLLIRVTNLSRLYYPAKFFDETAVEDDRSLIEEPSTMLPRRHRCLWLGVRIATFSRWMTYDQTRRFTPTRLAHEFAPIAQPTDHLSGNIYLAPSPSLVDQEMEGEFGMLYRVTTQLFSGPLCVWERVAWNMHSVGMTGWWNPGVSPFPFLDQCSRNHQPS
ncbi:hypothetical protein N7467_011497 [Penicillium canescens]|nr:hypothetical protein N7467_011497 [Penicillium canescens]